MLTIWCPTVSRSKSQGGNITTSQGGRVSAIMSQSVKQCPGVSVAASVPVATFEIHPHHENNDRFAHPPSQFYVGQNLYHKLLQDHSQANIQVSLSQSIIIIITIIQLNQNCDILFAGLLQKSCVFWFQAVSYTHLRAHET